MFSSLVKILNHPLNKKHKLRTVLRIVWWKINQLFFKLPAIVNLDDKIGCICYPCSSFGGLVIYEKLPEYAEMNFVQKNLQSTSIFLDIGANIGVYSLLAATKITQGKIFAFEPSPSALPNLYQNINLNNLGDKVEVIKKVVSDRCGVAQFVLEKESEVNHIFHNREKLSLANKQIKIPTVTLDKFIEEQKISSIRILKIDVEGAEMKVIKGFQKSLAMGKVKIIVIELNKKSKFYNSSNKQTADYLEKLGFKIYTFNVNNQLVKINNKFISNDQTYNVIAFYKDETPHL